MKAFQAYNGTSDKAKHFVIIQNDDMEVTAFQVDFISGNRSLNGTSLGIRGDIDDLEVQGQIIEKLFLS